MSALALDPATLATAAVGCIAGIAGAWVALRKDHREARAAAIDEANQTIEFMRQQAEIVKDHTAAREEEWRKLEEGWHHRQQQLEARVEGLERDYRQLVLTVTTMGLCANAATCPQYNPGDRRRPPGVSPSGASTVTA
ncbi:MAG: hypothetical protein GX624_09340 [Actinobacteria bacterium]|nr:hypothetical protein [Actinomycetota bacterium]